MDAMSTSTPPPLPPSIPHSTPPPPYKRNMTYGTKIVLLGFQCVVLMIGALIVWIISSSRESLNDDVASDIVKEWGGPIKINGPEIVVERIDSTIRQQTFACNVNVDTKSLHRNIYEAEVFNAHIGISGSLDKKNVSTLSDTINFRLKIGNKQISKLSPLKIGDKEIEWSDDNDDWLSAKIDISDLPQNIKYSTELDVRGSKKISVCPIGEKSIITIDGNAPNPSFGGSILTDDRTINGNYFSATWRNTPPSFVAKGNKRLIVETDFLVGVNRYQKVNRSLKYAFIIILLTYISALFTEIVTKHPIPLLNYFLIGVALIIFYILLLSFSEHLSFGMAYLIASSMTVLLISGYMWKMLDSKIIGALIGVILTIIYGSCFILLSLSSYALILGSLILFMALAAMMYASLKMQH